MGLELGPSWLVLVRDNLAGGAVILVQDNFTGAGMQRIKSARRHEPCSYAAVMFADGSLARHSDGRIYDPVEETTGRNGGTAAERGHRALLTAQALLRQNQDDAPGAWYPNRTIRTIGLCCIIVVLLIISRAG